MSLTEVTEQMLSKGVLIAKREALTPRERLREATQRLQADGIQAVTDEYYTVPMSVWKDVLKRL